MDNITIINGPNLNLLGKREPEIYGNQTLEQINKSLTITASKLELNLSFFECNSEGEIIDIIQATGSKSVGLIINPGGYSHTSVAILDALKMLSIPVIEVHLSNLYKREEFRHKSITASAAWGVISGFGSHGYHLALHALRRRLDEE
ncbi:MAG: type II 3-dehydroquinate dehydratase [candidate division Zixibacteria bacterium]|nr:type II 3-dehydroquinate dehydratase [candidate division Zixibacteria bacterium]MBU1470259.1 type II 3-dehydroquinate dehydratase [candidate division Zixibacteria bacterium]MBU2626423.1 type II 3-dehydroquinate dehydratase [candidate division Zixibacteria bacterium]